MSCGTNMRRPTSGQPEVEFRMVPSGSGPSGSGIRKPEVESGPSGSGYGQPEMGLDPYSEGDYPEVLQRASESEEEITEESEGTFNRGLLDSDPNEGGNPEASSGWIDESGGKPNESQAPNTMRDCIGIARNLLPGMVESSAQAQSQEDNLSLMLGLAQRMEKKSSFRFKSPELVAKSLVQKMDKLKGYVLHPEASGAERPLHTVSNLPKPSTKWKAGIRPAGLQDRILPNNLPAQFKTKASGPAINYQAVESMAMGLAATAEVQFDLLRLLMASLFVPSQGEESSAFFRKEANPDEVQNIVRGMLEANQAVVDTTSSLLGNSIVWRRQESLKHSSLPSEFKQGLISAPFNRETLFGQKPMAAVVEDSHNERVNRAITSMSSIQARKSTASQKRSFSSTVTNTPVRSFGQQHQPAKRRRNNQGFTGSRGRPSRGRGGSKKHNPQ